MFNFISNKIESIKQEPDYIKKRYAWGITLVFTAVIGAVWVTSIGDKFALDADVFKSLYEEQNRLDSVDIFEDENADIENILNGTGDEGISENPFDGSNLPADSGEEARLPQDDSTSSNPSSDDTEDDVIREGDTEDIENFDDYTDEELQEYLKKKESEFKDQVEEDLGGGMLP